VYTHLLIATDGSDVEQKAVVQGLAMAKALGAKATAVMVTEPWSSALSGELTGGLGITYSLEAHEKICAAQAKQALEAAAKLAQEIGVGCETDSPQGT
jgi:nucleotide-binding universal stress UspA family protein